MKRLLSIALAAVIPAAITHISSSASTVHSPSESGGQEFLDSVVSLRQVDVRVIKSTSSVTFPTAASTIGLSQIERLGIDGIKGVSDIAPNFYMPRYGSRMTSSIYVRGLGTRIEQPVVALNVDNVPMLSKDNYDFAFPDMSSVEVVRGAQSILYGRNSMGGVVNITTLSPFDFQGVRALAEYGSANTWRAQASAYFKASRSLGLAVIASAGGTDGFFRNEFTGRKVDKRTETLGKIKADWRPSARFRLENSLWLNYTHQGGYPYESVETGRIDHNDTCYYERLSFIDGLTMKYTSPSITFASITSTQYLNDDMHLDQDFLPLDYFTLRQKRHEIALSQDFVVKNTHVDTYNWLFGAFGFYRHTHMHAPVDFHEYGLQHLIEDNINSSLPNGMMLAFDERNLLLDSRFKLPTWGWALYHKSECRLARFTLSAGLRLAFERANIDYNSDVNASATMYRNTPVGLMPIATQPISVALADRLHQTSLQLLPEVKVAYAISPDIEIGAVFSKGYKAGGYNTQMFSDILQQQMMASHGTSSYYNPAEVISYRPEYSWNYEIDFAAKIPEASLSLDASLFLIDCRDQQMTVFPEGQTTGRMMTNAGRTRSIGVELTASWRPSTHWLARASYGLADARFRRYNDGRNDYRGKHVPYAPSNTLFGSVTWTTDFRSGIIDGIEISANCRAAGRIYWNEENTLTQPFYALLGLEATAHIGIADIRLWADNLTNTRFSTFYFESIGHSFTQRGNPRSVGISLRLTLGR